MDWTLMPSPFPGMNPYFETKDSFDQFHSKFIDALQDELVARTDDRYLIKSDQSVYIHEPSADERRQVGKPDVFVASARSASSSGVALAPFPRYADIPEWQEETVRSLHIFDKAGRELVTAIELLSPINKTIGSHRQQYLGKRATFVSRVNFVEIDLLRGSERMPIDGLPACDYCVLISRPLEHPKCGIWPIGLRERLPVIPIPLRAGDGDVRVDLQELINRVYDAGGFARYIYENEPEPPLSPADAQWAAQLR